MIKQACECLLLSLATLALGPATSAQSADGQQQPTASAVAPTTSATQYHVLNLPAGVSLISAPLKTGQTVAEDQFLGLPADYPLFYAWNPNTQEWVQGDQAPAAIGGGYWVFVATPTTLVVQGEPYGYDTAVTGTVNPGWHLFGVPFGEGVGWDDFHLYIAGNPISLDTAVAKGWIDSTMSTMQGSQLQYLQPGQPLQPGLAYWIHTTVPFQLRAQRQTGVSSTAADPTLPSPLASPMSSLATSGSMPNGCNYNNPGVSTTSYDDKSALGWISAVGEFLKDTVEGVQSLAEGNIIGSVFDFGGGTFGLIECANKTGACASDSIASDLTRTEGKVDTLITDVCGMAIQLNNVKSAVDALAAKTTYYDRLGQYVQSGGGWLSSYSTDPSQSTQSREWARWQLEGCSYGLVYTCPTVSDGTTPANQVSVASYQRFKASNMTAPGNGATASTDFPLFWAQKVLNQSSTSPWLTDGKDAGNIITSIFNGIMTHADPNTGELDDQGDTTDNPLLAYMYFALSKEQNGCTADVSASTCDLYNSVYLPLEAVFLNAVGDQTQLAEAVAESKVVMSVQGGGSYDDARTFMAGFNQKVNLEAEVFLEVAERIALYRAADGTHDWNTFGSSDAAQILARADYVVMKLAGQNYKTNPQAGYINPPWPASGVVGRVFYADGEPTLSGTRDVCVSSAAFTPGSANCPQPAGQIAETTKAPGNRVMRGDWPYLEWQPSTSPASGTIHSSWTVRRLEPASTPIELYAVNSTVPSRLGAPLHVASYDAYYKDCVSPDTAGCVTFGSFNGIEGPIGKYGLPLAASAWVTPKTDAIHEVQTSVSYNDATHAPGGAVLNVTYPYIGCTQELSASQSWTPAAQFQISSSGSNPQGWPSAWHYHVHWPTTMNVAVQGAMLAHVGAYLSPNYYDSIKFSQQLQDKAGKVVANSASQNASVSSNPCGASSFNYCGPKSSPQSLDVGSVSLGLNTPYSFKASFSTDVTPYAIFWILFVPFGSCYSSMGNSTASWVVNAPMISLTPQ